MKSVLNIHWKDWCWSWNSNTLATWCEELTHLKRPWCWERLKAGGQGDDRGWDGWMASPTWWTWVWVDSGSWWWEAWHAAVHGVAKSWTRLSDWTELTWEQKLCTFLNILISLLVIKVIKFPSTKLSHKEHSSISFTFWTYSNFKEDIF